VLVTTVIALTSDKRDRSISMVNYEFNKLKKNMSILVVLILTPCILIGSFGVYVYGSENINISQSNWNADRISNDTENLISPIVRGQVWNTSLMMNEFELPISVESLGNYTFLYEGDILMSLPRVSFNNITIENNGVVNESLVSIAMDKFILSDPWSNGVIPYQIDPSMPNKERISNAIKHWEENTPIRFTLLNDSNINDHSNYVTFVYNKNYPSSSDPICASRIGMVGGEQLVYIPNWCREGSIIHEIGHVVGLWHEQTRCDRDEFLEMRLENVDPRSKHNWESKCLEDPALESQNPLAPIGPGEYDYCSIEHYGRYAGTINGNPVIIPKKEVIGCDDIGQRLGLSDKDKVAIAEMYR
jgi:hypothetical protein